MRRLLPLTFLLLLAPLLSMPVGAGELAGVTLADSVRVDDQALVLNGLGLRKKAIFKVYVGGLYLTAKQSDPDAILEADTTRRMVLEFVRNVGADSIGDAWTDCLTANVSKPSAELEEQFAQLSSWMADVSSGDQLTFTYRPGKGTEVEVKGQSKGTAEGKAFADALFSCWIGAEPPSADFKVGLLGN